MSMAAGICWNLQIILTGEILFLFFRHVKIQDGPHILSKHNKIRFFKKHMGRNRMADNSNSDEGIRSLIRKYRKEFRLPENMKFYSENDFAEAEKKYIKFCLTGRPNTGFN